MPRLRPLLCLTATIFVAVFRLPESEGSVQENSNVRNCNQSFRCGELGNLTFPFWPDNPTSPPNPFCVVDGFGLICDSHPLIRLGGNHFRILHVNHSGSGRGGSMTLANDALFKPAAANPWNPENVTNLGDCNLLSYSKTNRNISLNVLAAARYPPENTFSCGGGRISLSLVNNSGLEPPKGCKHAVTVRVSGSGFDAWHNRSMQLLDALKLGFNVEFDFDTETTFACRCERGSDTVGTPNCKARVIATGSNRWKRKLAIGLGCGTFGGIAISGLVFYCYVQHKKRSSPISTLLSRRISSAPSMAMNSEIGGCFPGVHQFTYTELAQATDNFDSARSLGDGGFGTVYFGKLQDGRVVAVKRLYENNYRRVERFMNEVEIIARLRHKNLVVLYGCTSRHSRELLLVYEYVPNGTVADHLHGERAKPGGLPWPTRLKIAIETASALTYLHASDIIHRDVKTNNILLDDNFVVKVADFGLSRLFAAHVTHVSTVPQGTPGYIDPEYHQCYQLSDKSDVYSFGVVLIELISSMPAVDVTRHRHEINLAEVAINKIQGQALHELVDPSLGFESDYKLRKMIAAVAEVAFRCLQYERDMRPSIADVLQVLKGIESEDMNDEVVLLNSGPLPHSPDSP